MIHSKRLKLCLCLIILSVFIGACGMKKEESSKDCKCQYKNVHK